MEKVDFIKRILELKPSWQELTEDDLDPIVDYALKHEFWGKRVKTPADFLRFYAELERQYSDDIIKESLKDTRETSKKEKEEEKERLVEDKRKEKKEKEESIEKKNWKFKFKPTVHTTSEQLEEERINHWKSENLLWSSADWKKYREVILAPKEEDSRLR